MSPNTLSQAVDPSGAGMVPSSLGNFGHIDYGATTLGQVLIPNEQNAYGCNKFTWDNFPHETKGKNYFVMVKRGQCNNPTKAINI